MQHALEQRLWQLDQDIIDAQDGLLQEQQHQDAELIRLEGELTLLLTTPPAKDGRDDAQVQERFPCCQVNYCRAPNH